MPHDSRAVPSEVRTQFLLDDEALESELVAMTDHHTGNLFDVGVPPANVVRAPVSRLMVDVERFPDDADEPMAARGMGAVYVRTSRGAGLRCPLANDERQQLLDRYYRPHHERLTEAVDTALDHHGRCRVVDCHSFPSRPLPYESVQDPGRSEICIGTDPFHTSTRSRDAFVSAFERAGFGVAVDTPFAGALVPSRRYRSDRRVESMMVELNRGLYLDEATGIPIAAYPRLKHRIGMALRWASAAWELKRCWQ